MIKMYKTNTCGACKMVQASGVIEELNIEVINIDEQPNLRPEAMGGAPYFTKEVLTEGGTTKIVTHTGYANAEMLRNL